MTDKHTGVFITCAVTGGGATTAKSDKIPITPEEIANACIESAKAGAAITHVHVREDDGSASRDLGKYCLLYTSPSPRDRTRSRMPSSA